MTNSIKEGEKFNRLTFIRRAENYISPKGEKKKKGEFLCGCGNEIEAIITEVVCGKTKSCGCLQKERTSEANKRHEWHGSGIYNVWKGIKGRCYCKNNQDYRYYGGRGIKVCDSWIDDPKSFCSWAIQNGWQKGLTIDRIDNDGDYEPSNCRFVTQKENIRNSSRIKLSQEIADKIREIKALHPDYKIKDLAKMYGVTSTNIGDILRDKIWT